MNKHTQYFIALLNAFINEEETPRPGSDVDFMELYQESRMHSLSGMVGMMLKKLPLEDKPSKEVMKKFEQDFFSTIHKTTEQEASMNELSAVFHKEKIKHAFVKGYFLRDLYPTKELRSMGDVDFLISIKDRKKVHEIILELGYKSDTMVGHVWNYNKGSVRIEAHDKLISKELFSDVDYTAYFEDAIDHVILKKDSTYALEPDYQLLYLFIHMAKHFSGFGCGIRQIMDIAVFVKTYEQVLDHEYLKKEFQVLKMEQFVQNMIYLCKTWFNLETKLDGAQMDPSFYEELCTYIFSAGTFGFIGRNMGATILRKHYTEEKGFKRTLAKLKSFQKNIFPNYEFLQNSCPWFLNKPKIYFPVALVYRWYRVVFKRRKSSFRILGGMVKGSREAEYQYNVLSRLGL